MTRQTKSDELYLIVDQGGHATRALVFDHHANIVGQQVCPVTEQRPQTDWVEQDADHLMQSLITVINDVLKELGDDARQIKSAALTTQRSSMVCWDSRDGTALSPVISWQDRRTQDEIAVLQSHEQEVHQRSGLRLSPHYGASKFHWCLQNLPAVQTALTGQHLAYGPVASFFLNRLLQEHPHVVDPVNASRTMLWNRHTKDWDDDLLNLFQVEKTPLPQCVPNRYAFGHIKNVGFKIPLQLTIGDQSAALFSAGVPEDDTIYVNVGTGAFVLRVLRHNPGFDDALLTSVLYSDDESTLYALEGTVNGCGSALDWAQHELKLEAFWPQLPEWLDRISEPPLFINAISGLGSPYWQAHLQSEFIGDGDDPARIVAVVESIVFLIAVNLQEMLIGQTRMQHIRLSGGLSVLDGLCQRLADLSQLPVVRAAEPEATAKGAAYLLMEKPADWPKTEELYFMPAGNDALLDRFSRWQQQLHRRLARVLD